MLLRYCCLGIALLLEGAMLSAIGAEPAARTDSQGDPLPAGVRLRLGSGRLRHGGKVNALLFSANGAALLSAGDEETVYVWDTATGKEQRRLTGHQGSIAALAFTDAGRTLLATERGRVRLWDAGSGEPRQPPAGKVGLTTPLAMSSDGRLLALPSLRRTSIGTIELRDAASGRALHQLEGHQGGVHTLAFSPDARLLASGSSDETIRLWDTADGKERGKLVGHDNGIRLVVFAPDGKTLASISDDQTVRLWEVPTGKALHHIKTPPGWGCAAAFSMDGRLAIGSVGGFLQVFESGSGRRVKQWRAHPRMTCTVAWAPDGKTLASGGLDGRIRLWDPATGKELLATPGHQQAVTHVGWSADGKSLATAGRDDTLRVWDAADGKEQRQQANLAARGHLLAFSLGGEIAAARQSDGRIGGCSLASGEWIWQLPALPETEAVVCLTFADDGKLVTGHRDGTLRLWTKPPPALPMARVEEVRRFEGHNGIARRLHVSADGRFLVSYSTPKQLQLWDVKTGKLLRSLAEPPELLWSLAVSPDGRIVAAGGGEFTIRLWETTTGQPRGALIGHRLEARALAFTRDSRLLLTGGGDRTLRVWQTGTDRERGHFDTPSPINALVLSPDERAAAAANEDGTALVWDLALLPRQPKRPLEDLAGADLNRLWSDLAGTDAVKAHQAQCELALHRVQAIAFLKQQLRKIVPPDDKRLQALLTELDSDYFVKRERASRELAELGDLAEPALRQALDKPLSAEVQRRIKDLLEQLEKARQPGAAPIPQQLRDSRAVEVLERLGNTEAQALLAELAEGYRQARLTQEAREALRRMRRPPARK
jgi:WD40 repeat protein